MKSKIETLLFTTLVLLVMGVVPNLFVVAQAGLAKFSFLGKYFLLPSVIVMLIVLPLMYMHNQIDLARQILIGLSGGLLGTAGLEIVRHSGFLLGGMPGEMPKLMGVLLLDRFAQGPDITSNLAGWGYHFWNGAAFGIIYTLLVGRGNLLVGIAYGLLIGLGFMVSPAALSLGVGLFGADFGWGFPVTVILAHIVFGSILGIYVYLKSSGAKNIIYRIKIILTE